MAEQPAVNAMAKLFGDGEYYAHWSKTRDRGLYPCEAAMVQTWCTHRDAAIVTIGCGTGRETFALYRLGYHNIRGVDCTEALLRIARDYAAAQHLAIPFDLASADALPLEDCSVDAITLFENLYGHITPYTARLAALAEARRVLRPGGLVFMTVTALAHRWRHYFYIRSLETLRLAYNPHSMEKGDKFMRRDPRSQNRARSHWFRAYEVPDDAGRSGFAVLQQTTDRDIRLNPSGNSTRVHHGGRLLYVLGRD
jgi:SAM-dependent methyltransferase